MLLAPSLIAPPAALVPSSGPHVSLPSTEAAPSPPPASQPPAVLSAAAGKAGEEGKDDAAADDADAEAAGAAAVAAAAAAAAAAVCRKDRRERGLVSLQSVFTKAWRTEYTWAARRGAYSCASRWDGGRRDATAATAP